MTNPEEHVLDIDPATDEKRLPGLGVSPGVAIGTAFLHDTGAVQVPQYKIGKDQVTGERQRFVEAVAAAVHQVEKLQHTVLGLSNSAGEELGYLLDAYQQMLKGSRLVRGVDRRITEERINAEAAVQREIAETISNFAAMDDTYLAARAEDIREVGRRLVRNLTKTPYRPFSNLPKKAIILAEELSPADTALFDSRSVAGMATVLGGETSHTAILARSLGLPAVVGITGMVAGLPPKVRAIIDGDNGLVILNPTAETLVHYRQKRADYLRSCRRLNRLRTMPAVTVDGIEINLLANLELPTEIGHVLESGAGGIGLLRSEFLYMNRNDLPSEDEQTAIYSQLVSRLQGRVLTIRTLDAGGDKLAPLLAEGWIGPNPALGLRAIRLSLRHPEILETQLAAILRASVLGPVRILLPMVSAVEELTAVRAILSNVVERLRSQHIPFADPLPPIGTMIEVPSAALIADALAQQVDFFAIGTNDLTQYTLAIDRADEAVAHLYNPLHPAVLRLLKFTTESARQHHIPVSVCGEVAGDPRYTPLLLGLGIRDLSMASINIPRVKQRVRTLSMASAIRTAEEIMQQQDSRRIAEILDEFKTR